MGLEELLLGLTVLLFVAQVLAWRWSRHVERRLLGQHGYELARTITWIIGWSLVARLVGTASIAILGVDRNNMDSALFLALMAQIGGAIIFVGAALRIRRFSRDDDSDLDSTDPEGAQGLEGVGVQVDDVGPRPAVAVDDTNANAALSGTH
jgi:hypothetical protein